MSRNFTIMLDASWLSGSLATGPIIQHVNSVPALKNTGTPYIIYVGDKKI